MKNEIWRPIIKFPYYEASNSGNIRSLDKVVNSRFGTATKKGRVLRKHINAGGYYRVGLSLGNSKMKFPKVSVLVALAWHRNPENKKCVNHKDTVKTNDCEWNLEWATHRENTLHMIKMGCRKSFKHSKETIQKIVEKSNTPVLATNILTNETKEFPSMKACAEHLGYTPSAITIAIKKRTITRTNFFVELIKELK